MGEAISWEIRERAEELYIMEGKTFAQVADETSVSESQLKRWADEGGWSERKKEYRAAFSDIRKNTVKLRKALIEKALGSLDPQDIYAAVRLESVSARTITKEGKPAEIDRPRIFLEDMEFVAKTLAAIDPEALKVLGKHFDAIVTRYKEAHEAQA
jgi:transposase-like protein